MANWLQNLGMQFVAELRNALGLCGLLACVGCWPAAVITCQLVAELRDSKRNLGMPLFCVCVCVRCCPGARTAKKI